MQTFDIDDLFASTEQDGPIFAGLMDDYSRTAGPLLAEMSPATRDAALGAYGRQSKAMPPLIEPLDVWGPLVAEMGDPIPEQVHFEYVTRTPVPGSPFLGFDAYCDEHDIQPGEEPAAFAAYLNQKTGWDGPMAPVHESAVVHPDTQALMEMWEHAAEHGIEDVTYLPVEQYDALMADLAGEPAEPNPALVNTLRSHLLTVCQESPGCLAETHVPTCPEEKS